MNLLDKIERPLIIVNLNSNEKRSIKKWKQVESYLDYKGIRYDVEFTEKREQSVDLVSKDEIHKIIIGINGEGGQNAIVEGAMKNPLEKFLGMIPAGIANDATKVFKGCSTKEKLYNSLKFPNVREIDIGVINENYFLVHAGIGFGVTILEERNKRRFLKGKPAYYAAALRAFFKYNPIEMKIEFKGKKINGKFFLGVFSNLGPYADGLKICPGANPYDRKLDLCLGKGKPNLATLVYDFSLARYGKHINRPEISCYRAKQFEIFSEIPIKYQIDGDIIGESDYLKVRIASKKLKMLV